MEDSKGDRQGAGCAGYERLVSSEYEYDPTLAILSRSLITRRGNPRGRPFALLKRQVASRLLSYDFARLSSRSV